MKKLFSIFGVLFITIISMFHHSIIAFSHAENSEHSHLINSEVILHHHHDTVDHENHDFEEENFLTTRNNLDFDLEDVEVIIKKSYLDLIALDYFLLENNKLVKITSPPILDRKIKYYSYLDLTKIIKSNT